MFRDTRVPYDFLMWQDTELKSIILSSDYAMIRCIYAKSGKRNLHQRQLRRVVPRGKVKMRPPLPPESQKKPVADGEISCLEGGQDHFDSFWALSVSRTLLSCVSPAKSVDTFLPAGLGAIRMFWEKWKSGSSQSQGCCVFPQSSSYYMRYLQPLELENVADMVIPGRRRWIGLVRSVVIW